MELDELKAKIEDLRGLKKEDLERVLQELQENFQEKTGLNLALIVRSYKTALAGTREEKVTLRADALKDGTETEYWLGYGISFGDRTAFSVVLEAIGTKVPGVKYAARVLESYVVTDALLSAVDRSIGGLFREGVEKVRETVRGKVSQVTSNRTSKTEEGLVDWLKEDTSPVELSKPEMPEEDNPYF